MKVIVAIFHNISPNVCMYIHRSIIYYNNNRLKCIGTDFTFVLCTTDPNISRSRSHVANVYSFSSPGSQYGGSLAVKWPYGSRAAWRTFWLAPERCP